jgi:uncharacterized protein YdhG (YjbR/CyaY superfamily)
LPGTDRSTGLEARSTRSTTKQPAKKAAARRPGRAGKADGESALLANIAAMPGPDRSIGERLHAIIRASAPALSPKLWYGMPAYAKDGKVICFFRESHTRPGTGRAPSVGAMRYATFGFYDAANLDEDGLWPVAFAVTELTAAAEAKIAALVEKAVR